MRKLGEEIAIAVDAFVRMIKNPIVTFIIGAMFGVGVLNTPCAHAQVVDQSYAIKWTLPTTRADAAKTPLAVTEIDSSYVVVSVGMPFTDANGVLVSPLPLGTQVTKVLVPTTSVVSTVVLAPSKTPYTIYYGVYAVDLFGQAGAAATSSLQVTVSPGSPPGIPTGVSATFTCKITKCVVN